MPKLKDSKGRLTAYAFACGYVERHGALILTRDMRVDTPVYIVKGFITKGHIYQVFPNLRVARNFLKTKKQ